MEIEIKEIETSNLNDVSGSVVILPHNYSSNDSYEYHSTTLSFYKFAKDRLRISYLTEPELLIEQRSGEWFGPVLLFTSAAVSADPNLVSVTCGVIANYVTDFFRGRPTPNVRLKILHKESKTAKLTEISYEGDIEGLVKLEAAILEIAKKG